MKLNVGVIGLGDRWDSRYRSALRTLSDRFEVRAICGDVAHLARRAAEEFRATAVDGYRALATRSDVDVILMLEEQWYGALPVLAACDAGKAIYCFSGFQPDQATAQRMRDRVNQAGIAFMAEFPNRHAPATLRLKELIATRLGKPRLLFCHQRAPLETPRKGGRRNGTRRATDALVELVDWCRYVVGGEPNSVMGAFHKFGPVMSKHDYQMMSLDFSPVGQPGTGAMAQISYGRYIRNDWPEAVSFRPPAALQVACENGVAFVDLPTTLIWFDQAGRHMESLESERPVGELMLLQFHRSVTSLVRHTANLQDVIRALEIVHMARQSYLEGCRMPL